MTIEEAVEIVTNELQSDESKYNYKVDKALSMIQTLVEMDESLVTLITKTIFNEDRLKELVDEAVKEAGLKWIPVSEGDPNEDGRYLCSNEKGDISIYCYTSNLYKLDEYAFSRFKHKKDKSGWYSYDSDYGYFEVDGVAAWKTLPEGYKEVNE